MLCTFVDIVSQSLYRLEILKIKRCEFESHSWLGVLDTTSCDQVCQWLATGRWFSLGSSVSSINKTDRHDIIEILLKVALNTINLTPSPIILTNLVFISDSFDLFTSNGYKSPYVTLVGQGTYTDQNPYVLDQSYATIIDHVLHKGGYKAVDAKVRSVFSKQLWCPKSLKKPKE